MEKDWISENEIDESEVRLCRYSEDKWE
ncbi:PGF-pre-PGF domain-containing protein [Methanosarcina sp. KYL-1]|nr:PGF-pre-PGF domain-containing protein [Methanosarcina sp. KYL-1]